MLLCGIVLKGYSQKVIEDVGHYAQLGLPIAALGIAVAKGDRQGIVQLGKSVLVESVIVYGMKQVIDRERPNGGRFAFPSGHTALSFTSATFLYRRYGWKVGVPATVVASFVGYSRFGIDEPVHYFTDVIAGAAIGVATSLLLTSKLDEPGAISLGGSWSGESASLYASLRF